MDAAPHPILIAFAVPHESRDFRRSRPAFFHRLIHTGIGSDAATSSVKAALQSSPTEFLLSAGFAGGLDPELAVSELVADSSRSAPKLIAKIPGRVRRGVFLSVPAPLESPSAKEEAYRNTGAVAVDMETEAIANACVEAGVPALFLRVISDGARDAIPLPFSATYSLRWQRPRPIAICLALLLSPNRIAPFRRFLRDLKTARAVLTRSIFEFLATCDASPR